MADTSVARGYGESSFVGLQPGFTVNLPVLRSEFEAAAFEEQPSVEGRHGDGVVVRWDVFPPQSDIILADSLIATHDGGETTSGPFVESNQGPVTTSSFSPTNVVNLVTPALDEGTYHLDFSSQFRMTSIVNGEAARAMFALTIGNGTTSTQQDVNTLNSDCAYNGSATFKVPAGASVQAQLQISEVGPGAGTAEMTKARVTITRVEP